MKNISNKFKESAKKAWKNGKKAALPLVAGAGLSLATLLNPTNAYSQVQDSTKYNVSNLTKEQKLRIQRGVYTPVLKDSTDTHYMFELGFNENLEKAIKNTQKPELFLTGNAAKGSYIKFNEDRTAAELYYPKKYFNEQGIGEDIGISLIHEGGSIDICSPDIPGSKTNPLASFYWIPSKSPYKQPLAQEPKEPEKLDGYNGINLVIRQDYNIINEAQEPSKELETLTEDTEEPKRKNKSHIIEGVSMGDEYWEVDAGVGHGPVSLVLNYGVKQDEVIDKVKTDPFPKTGRYGEGIKYNTDISAIGGSVLANFFPNKSVSGSIGIGANKWNYTEKVEERIMDAEGNVVKENSNSDAKSEISLKIPGFAFFDIGENTRGFGKVEYDTKIGWTFGGGIKYEF